MNKLSVLALLSLLASVSEAQTYVNSSFPPAGSVSSTPVTWTPPTTDVNGNPIPAGTVLTYNLYATSGAASTIGMQVKGIPCATPPLCSFTLVNWPAGTYVFAMTAVDSQGESALSATVTSAIILETPGVPSPPVNLTAGPSKK